MESAVSEIAVGLESAIGAAEPSSVHNKETTLSNSTGYGDVGDIGDPAYWPQDEYRTEQFREYRPETIAAIALYKESDAIDGTYFMEAFNECQSKAKLWRSDKTGLLEAHGTSCHLPFCPVCDNKRAKSIYHRLYRELLPYAKADRLRSVCLTLKHTGLKEDIDWMQTSWAKLSRRVGWLDYSDGADWFLQCKPVERGLEWHVHRHVLVIGSYIPQKWLSKTWEKITGDSFDVYIQSIKGERGLALALRDIARYVSRPANILGVAPEHRLELLRALRGRRLCGSTGLGRQVSFATRDPNEPMRPGHYVGDFEKIKRLAKSGNEDAEFILRCYKTNIPCPPDVSCDDNDFAGDLSPVESLPSNLFSANERSPPGTGACYYEGDVFDKNVPW